MKKIISILLLLAALVSLASCQLSEIIPPSNRVDGSGTSSGTTTGTPTTSEEDELLETPKYDFMGTDLTQFVELCEYKGIKLKSNEIEVTDEILNRYIGQMLVVEDQFEKRRTGILNEFDIVSMDYVGKLDGTPFSGGTAKDIKFLVTENQSYIYATSSDQTITPGYGYIAGFANEMIGNDISAPFDINVTFPENYGQKDLAGKAVVFTITINHVFQPLELNETTLKEISDEKTVDDFKKKIKDSLSAQYSDMAREHIDSEVWKHLVEKSTFKALPTEYVDAMFESEYQYIEYIAKMYGMTPEALLMQSYGYSSKEQFKQVIETDVKQSIVCYQILKEEGLEITEEDYQKRLAEIAKNQGVTSEEMEKNYTKDYILNVFRFEVVNQFIYENCVIEKQ